MTWQIWKIFVRRLNLEIKMESKMLKSKSKMVQLNQKKIQNNQIDPMLCNNFILPWK